MSIVKLRTLGIHFLSASVLITSAMPARADVGCSGKVDMLNQAYDGSVNLTSVQIYGNSTGRTLCNVASVWKGVEPAVCKSWLAALLVAKTTGGSITVQYNDGTTACSQQPAYSGASFPWAIW